MSSLRRAYDASPAAKRRGMTIANHRKQGLHLLSQALRFEEQHQQLQEQDEAMDNRLVLSIYKLGVKVREPKRGYKRL